MEQTTTSVRNSSNHSHYIQSSPHVFPKSPMPAWVPAVSVATAMMVFLAISFYMRHRKVVKKRQLLMDYFYIIVQYGGLRRKRMVTALCNTNAISLRHLGRSFMISFDNENSCPFYLEDTAFTKTNTSFSHSKNTPKTRNRLTVPFKRVMSQIDDSALGNSVHDMLMKFKSKKKSSHSSNSNKSGLAPPRGMSLSSIHEDTQRSDYEGSARFRQRRNAYRLDSCESQLLGESDDQSLSNVIVEHYIPRKMSSLRQRSSPSIGNEGDEEDFHVLSPSSHNLRVFQFGANNSISFRQQSQSKTDNCRQNSKKEPLILVHAASNDMSSSQDSDDVLNPCSNGVVVLRRVSTECSGQDCYYVSENPAPSYKRNKRASVSTVSYVQSGNMNDYYQHCLHSSSHSINSKVEDDEFNIEEDKNMSSRFSSGFPWKKGAAKGDATQNPAGPPRSKRSRLSLGEIGISNFNQRIEESLGSMQEQESDGSCSRLSKEVSDERTKPHGAWKRLKNVFAGIRWSQSSGSKNKQMKSSTSEERGKTKSKRSNNHGNRKWNRFFKSLTGFRSFPEEKQGSIIYTGPKASKSLPLGLDKHSITIEDLEFHIRTSLDPPPASKNKKRCTKDSFSKGNTLDVKKYFLRGPPKTRSFPENMSFFQGDNRNTPHLLHLQSDPSGTSTYHNGSARKNKRRYNNECGDYLRAHSAIDFIHSPLRSNYLSFSQDSNTKTYRFPSGSISPKTTSPVTKKKDRQYRSLIPLPEKLSSSSPRKGKNVRWYSHSERNSLSERGFLISPDPRGRAGNSFLFPGEKPTRGKSLTNIPLNNESPHGSYRDLSSSILLNVKESYPKSPTKTPPTEIPAGSDFVTIEMEPSLIQKDENVNHVENKLGCNNEEIKEEPCSFQTSSMQEMEIVKYFGDENIINESTANENIGFEMVDEESSMQINDNTNSSLDSVYFDAFSIPGSPLVALKQNERISHHCEYSFNNINSSTTCSTGSLLSVSSSTFGVATTTTTISTEINTAAFTTTITDASSCPTSTTSVTPPPSSYYPPPPVFSVEHDPVCEGNIVSNSNNLSTCSSPSHVVDFSPALLPDDKDEDYMSVHCSETTPLTLTSQCDAEVEETSEDEFNEETRLLVDSSNTMCVTSEIERNRLETQNSTTSEDSLINFTRLPRFGRRASNTSVPRSPS